MTFLMETLFSLLKCLSGYDVLMLKVLRMLAFNREDIRTVYYMLES